MKKTSVVKETIVDVSEPMSVFLDEQHAGYKVTVQYFSSPSQSTYFCLPDKNLNAARKYSDVMKRKMIAQHSEFVRRVK